MRFRGAAARLSLFSLPCLPREAEQVAPAAALRPAALGQHPHHGGKQRGPEGRRGLRLLLPGARALSRKREVPPVKLQRPAGLRASSLLDRNRSREKRPDTPIMTERPRLPPQSGGVTQRTPLRTVETVQVPPTGSPQRYLKPEEMPCHWLKTSSLEPS